MDEEEIPQLVESGGDQAHTSSLQPTQETFSRVPLTILTGFLGAGKSTLLRRILTEKHGYRIAVIMNEFGDTTDLESLNISSTSENVDGQLAKEMLELPNGCLCCSVKDVGIASIEKLMEKKGAFDYILLETTGLADPAPIAELFWQNEEYGSGLGSQIALDGIVCLLDAVFGLEQIEKDKKVEGIGESLRQLACADVVLLNKCDLASSDLIQKTERAIRTFNDSIPIHRTIRGELSLDKILNLDAFHSRPQIAADYGQLGYDNDHDHQDHTHDHFRGVSSLMIPLPTLSPQHEEILDEWIRRLLWDGLYEGEKAPVSTQAGGNDTESSSKVKILRCKGVYWNQKGDQVIIQGVQTLYETTVVANGQAVDTGKIVLIGTGLGEDIKASLLRSLDVT